MDYLPTLGEKWPHPRGNVGNYSLHGASGLLWLPPVFSEVVFLPLEIHISGFSDQHHGLRCLRFGVGEAQKVMSAKSGENEV